jgi:hypothetical protein
MKNNMRKRLTPEDLLVLCLLSVGDHVLNGGGRVAAQLGEAHGQASSLPSHCIILATGASSEIFLYFGSGSSWIRINFRLSWIQELGT